MRYLCGLGLTLAAVLLLGLHQPECALLVVMVAVLVLGNELLKHIHGW